MIASVIPRVTTMANGSFNNFTEDGSLSLTAELKGELSSKIQGESLSLTELDGELLELPAAREIQDRTIPAVSAKDFAELEEPGTPPMELQFPAPADDPLPDCLTILERLNEEHGLDNPIIIDKGNGEIVVIGENVETIEPQILDALEHLRISKIWVKNIIRDPSTAGCVKLLSCQVTKMVSISKNWEFDGTVFCELIIQDSGENGAIYAVIPAHLILTIEQSRHLAKVSSDISDARELVTTQWMECKYVFKNENHDESVVLQPPPLLAYRHWESGPAIDTTDSEMPRKETEHKKSEVFMNDIALLRFKSYKHDELADKVEVFPIPTKQHLDALARRKQRVIIGNHEGMLVRSPEGVGSMNHHYGLHLSFIITSKGPEGQISELSSGSSGLVVFFKGKQGQLIPVGMLVSKLSVDIEIHGSSIYQAIVLSQALKEIEQDYPQQISHIRVLETCHRFKGTNMVTNQRTMEPAIQGDIGSQEIAAVAQTEVKSDVASNKTPNDSTVELIKPRPATTLHTAMGERPLVTSTEPSHQGSDVALSDLKPKQRKMEGIWPRHSVQHAVYDIPHCSDDSEILEDIDKHHITHTPDEDVPRLELVAHKLKKLKIDSDAYQTTSGLNSLKSLTEPKEWEIEQVELSDGLSSDIFHLAPLETVELEYCELTNLQESSATTLHTAVRKGPLIISKEPSHQGSDVELSSLKSKQRTMEDTLGLGIQARRRKTTDGSEGIWYRHSGQPAVYCIPSLWSCTFKTFEDDTEILEDIGTHHITHMYVQEGDVPSLNFVAPRLTALKIERSHGDQTTSALRSLKSLTELKELDIEGVDLSDGLPPGISHVTSLRMLKLRRCRLTDLPESLTTLTKLWYLTLEGSEFRNSLLEVVGRLTSLERLELSRCGLNHLPTSMSSLSNLKYLRLDDNDFSKGLPEVFTQLTSLETLDLRRCKLTNLPTSMSSLSNLKYLDLDDNDFSEGLPQVFGELTSLETLSLAHCKLTNLPTSFDKLTKLGDLRLADNHFKSFPPVICELKNLRILSLGGNEQLESLHPGILHLSKLCALLVYGCPSLTTPPQKVSKQGLEAIKQYYKDLEK